MTDSDNAENTHQSADDPYQPDMQAVVRARRHLEDLLALRGIALVINVDDGNRQDDDAEIDVPLILNTLTTGLLSLAIIAATESVRLEVVDGDGELQDLPDILDRLRLDPPAFSDDALQELTNAARLANRAHTAAMGGEEGPHANQAPATSAAAMSDDLVSLAELPSLFPTTATFQALTLAQWTKQKEAILGDSHTPVLILFDRDFQYEGESSEAGDALVSEVLAARHQHVYCCMLTHSATSDQAERELIERITQAHDLSRTRLIIMAKNQVIEAPEQLARKLKAALLSEELTALCEAAAQSLADADADGIVELLALDPFTVQALVDAAAQEGSHETHNLIRIAESHRRRSLDRRLRHPDLTGSMRLLQQARSVGPSENVLPLPANLAAMRHADRFDGAVHLSQLNLPIEPGDIFELINLESLLKGSPIPKKERFILLTQPCDTMVRPETGTRMANPALLDVAPMKWIDDPEPGCSSRVKRTDFPLQWFEENRTGGEWYVRLAERTQVPARALDACSLSSDGTGVIRIGDVPAAHLTQGWLKVHERLQKWADCNVRKLGRLEQAPGFNDELKRMVVGSLMGASKQLHMIPAAIDADQRVVAFGVRRIARLTDPTTRALLTLASHHAGRPAEDGPLLADPPDGTQSQIGQKLGVARPPNRA